MKSEYLSGYQNVAANLETYGGFSSYLYKQNRTRDHCVIGQDNFYMSIRITMLISIVIATVFTFVTLPIPIMNHYKQAHDEMARGQPNSKSDSLYFVGAAVIESIMLWIFFVCYFIHGIIKRAPEANTEAEVKIHYYVFMLLLFTYPIAIFCYIIWMSRKKGLKYRHITNGSESSTISLIYYCSGFTAITCIAQFIVFHGVYIAIATTIVSAVQILSFIFLCVGLAISVLVGIAYTLKAIDKKSLSCSPQSLIMFILLNTVLIWNLVTFIYINEHGNFPIIMRSLSVLSIAGFIAKDTVKKYIIKNLRNLL